MPEVGSASRHATHGALRSRAAIVWSALGVSTLVVGALLSLVGGSPERGATGRSIPVVPLMRSATPQTAEAIFQTKAPLDEARWSGIVIHHSGTPSGTPGSLDERHRALGLVGLGYHFVIGNGIGMGDGELHVGRRWLEQQPGAHVAGPRGQRLNRETIGICLVGDGDRRPFSEAQLRRLFGVILELRDRFGIDADRVMLHEDVASTSSPGRYFPRSRLAEQLAEFR